MSSHAAEALAFVAAAGGLIAAARLYQASRAQHQTEREARFDASATKSVRSTHDPSEMALGPGPDGTPGPVEVEHFPLMHLRDQFPDAETFQRCAPCVRWRRRRAASETKWCPSQLHGEARRRAADAAAAVARALTPLTAACCGCNYVPVCSEPLRRRRGAHSRVLVLPPAPSTSSNYCPCSPLVARKWPRNQNFRGENEEILTTQVRAHTEREATHDGAER